ncbi:MAG: hypothetical protein AUJ51_07380 [Elusimicrobia bacterium CG1_02_56_21]|nr:MAG: hypothetical protein AUJ51_07380 [Elusimicrobia bacterium CG1_02_56_21]
MTDFKLLAPALVLSALLTACSARYDDAVVLQRQGRLAEAAEKYKAFALNNPAAPDAPRALMAAAEIYSLQLGLCLESKPLLERLARDYPSFRMPEDVFRSIFVCPDYFPAGPGMKWVYGDSDTKGQNAREVVAVAVHSSQGSGVTSSFYAGTELVSGIKKTYRFAGMNFVEREAGLDTLILNYPLETGKTWASTGQEGRLKFLVEKTGLTVKVKAGEFTDCIKVRRRAEGGSSWVYNYYAPWKGKILTSVAGPGFENRVMELLSYEEKK